MRIGASFSALLLVLAFATLATSTGSEQQYRTPVVGLLVTHAPTTDPIFDFLRSGLRQYGYEDGKTIRVETRTALGQLDRLPRLVAELVQLKPDVILVVNEIAVQAAAKATSTIPIVMVGYTTSDPVALGLIESYAHPGKNVTGLFSLDSELLAKRLEILKEALPNAKRVVALWDPTFGHRQLDELQRQARPLGLDLRPIEVRKAEDLEPAFRAAKQERAGAVIMTFSPLFWTQQGRVVQLALEAKLPVVSEFYQIVDAGGLLSYGSAGPENWLRAAYYVDRLLKGASPADLPVERVSKLKLTVNLKTARLLGVELPESIVARADRIIR